jgi:hypothetical protein
MSSGYLREEGAVLEAIQFISMRLETVIIQVSDVQMLDECREWYSNLGLSKKPFDEPGESNWFDVGNDATLGIHTAPTAAPSGFELYLTVPDVDKAYVSLRQRGFEFESVPETKFWGRSARLSDPAGTKIVLISH